MHLLTECLLVEQHLLSVETRASSAPDERRVMRTRRVELMAARQRGTLTQDKVEAAILLLEAWGH